MRASGSVPSSFVKVGSNLVRRSVTFGISVVPSIGLARAASSRDLPILKTELSSCVWARLGGPVPSKSSSDSNSESVR